MDDLSFLHVLSSILILLTTVLYSYQIIYLFLPLFLKRRKHRPVKLHRYAILIAARNEQAVLPFLLDSIRAQDYPAELIDMYVVADNCTDETARVAAEHGAHVYTRFNKQQVGKGYALNYLLEHMRSDNLLEQYDAFLIFDADNLLEPDYVSKMNQLPSDGYLAFCGYRNTKNFGTNWITSGYALWYLHESTHMNRSRYTVGSSSTVNGTGFGFTRELLDQIGTWHFFTLTEDIEFSYWCASHGVKIGYCQDAILYDEQPVTFTQSWKQRTRWAQGGFQVSIRYIGSLLKGFFKGRWITYACTELFTLSMWGFSLTGVTAALSFLLVLTSATPLVIGKTLIGILGTAYLSMAGIGLWTVLMEWRRIHATSLQKILSIFSFPIFMMSFFPITVCAAFRKFQWEPIDHTVAISTADLSRKL